MTHPAPGYVLVVSIQSLDASTALFFGHLLNRAPGTIRIVESGRDDMATALGEASAVVLVRGLFDLSPVTLCARVLGIPIYYFLDDNFMLLREQPGPWFHLLMSRYSVGAVKRRLRAFDGVLLGTTALVDYFAEHDLHPRSVLFPPIAWHERLRLVSGDRSRLHVAFFGGKHLHDVFFDAVVPAVRRLARRQPVKLIAVAVDRPVVPSEGLEVCHEPFDPSYVRGVLKLAHQRVDVLVHPSAKGLRNNPYKNPHALITADALSAVPLVSDRPPYAHLRSAGVALLCEDSEESWYQALVMAAQEDCHAAILARLSEYCPNHFGGSLNREVLAAMSRRQPPFGAWRVRIAQACLRVGRLYYRIKPF